nr:hypothetical protein [Tanacetum cinerariifolium]
MAIQGKLMTCDRMVKWGTYNMTVCSLCKRNVKSHDHLFFNYQFTGAIWKKLKEMMQVQSNTAGWDNIIDEFADMTNKSSILSIVRRLCPAFAVYSIWRERNNRVFRDEVCNWEVVFEMICETVRLKLIGLIVKNTNAVQLVAKNWNVDWKSPLCIVNGSDILHNDALSRKPMPLWLQVEWYGAYMSCGNVVVRIWFDAAAGGKADEIL